MSEDNGGPAFPVTNDANVKGQAGMNLLDYFAGQALANPAICDSELGEHERALVAYEQAEYMLKVRTTHD